MYCMRSIRVYLEAMKVTRMKSGDGHADPNVGGLGEERLGSGQDEFSYRLIVDVFLDRAEHVDRRLLHTKDRPRQSYIADLAPVA